MSWLVRVATVGVAILLFNYVVATIVTGTRDEVNSMKQDLQEVREEIKGLTAAIHDRRSQWTTS